MIFRHVFLLSFIPSLMQFNAAAGQHEFFIHTFSCHRPTTNWISFYSPLFESRLFIDLQDLVGGEEFMEEYLTVWNIDSDVNGLRRCSFSLRRKWELILIGDSLEAYIKLRFNYDGWTKLFKYCVDGKLLSEQKTCLIIFWVFCLEFRNNGE